MAREHTRLEVLRNAELVEPSRSPFEGGARSASEACALLETHGVAMNLPTLRWYRNVNLIDRPVREGRNAVYRQALLDEVASLRALQGLYGRSIDELRELRRRRITFTEVVRHLLRLERAHSRRAEKAEEKIASTAWVWALDRLGLVNEFFERVLQDSERPGSLVLKGSLPLVVRLGIPRRV